jgi:hypothetical protein
MSCDNQNVTYDFPSKSVELMTFMKVSTWWAHSRREKHFCLICDERNKVMAYFPTVMTLKATEIDRKTFTCISKILGEYELSGEMFS